MRPSNLLCAGGVANGTRFTQVRDHAHLNYRRRAEGRAEGRQGPASDRLALPMPHPPSGTTLDLATTVSPEMRERESLPPLPALTVLSHPDLARIGDRVFLGELVRGREASLSRQEPRFTAPRAASGEPLADPFLSRRPLRFTPLAGGGVALR